MASSKKHIPGQQLRVAWNQATNASDRHLVQMFHDAAANGDKRRVRRCLKSGIIML